MVGPQDPVSISSGCRVKFPLSFSTVIAVCSLQPYASGKQ